MTKPPPGRYVAPQRKRLLQEVLRNLKQERARMERDDHYILANVFGMNNAITVVENMMPKEVKDDAGDG